MIVSIFALLVLGAFVSGIGSYEEDDCYALEFHTGFRYMFVALAGALSMVTILIALGYR